MLIRILIKTLKKKIIRMLITTMKNMEFNYNFDNNIAQTNILNCNFDKHFEKNAI